MGKGSGKNSKNNPDNKVKRKEYKVYDTQHCLKCPEYENCKEYNDYQIKMAKKGKGFGITCKSGR